MPLNQILPHSDINPSYFTGEELDSGIKKRKIPSEPSKSEQVAKMMQEYTDRLEIEERAYMQMLDRKLAKKGKEPKN